MLRVKNKRRMLLFLVFFIVLLLGGPASAEEEALQPPSVALTAKQFVYTGEVQYLTLDSLSHPLSSEGHYSFHWYKNGELLSHASDALPIREVSDSGIYYCKVTFTYGGKTSEKCTDSVEIKVEKKMVDVPQISPLFYTGYRQHPSVYATAEYEVTENGGGIGAGTYSVLLALNDTENTAFCPSAGVEILDGGRARVPYEIQRAENFFSTPFSVSDCYEGGAPAMRAFARFGEVRYRYFSDAEGHSEISRPLGCGMYYAQAYVEQTQNFSALYSQILRFEILPLSVSALRVLTPPSRLSYTAFERVDLSGLSLVATMTDGSLFSVPSSSVTVTYPVGKSCLFAKDTYVLLNYSGASIPLPLSVRRAVLDFSGVKWSAVGWVYDGVEREITVSALPSAASVSTYSGNRITDAGTHTVYASLSYDRDNYEGPTQLSYTLSVVRQTVPLPSLSPAVYDGTVICAPINATPLYFPEQVPSAVHAGKYTVRLFLSDPKNFVFEGGAESAEVIFEILPRELLVTVEDVTLWLGEKFAPPAYSIVAGSPIAGDDLLFRAEYSGGRASYAFENPDYRVRFEGGEVIFTYRLPPAAEAALFLGLTAIFLFGLLLFFLIFVYRKKHRHVSAPLGTHTCTYPLFTKEPPPLSREDKEYLISEQAPQTLEEADPAESALLAEDPAEVAEDACDTCAAVDAVDVSTADALITDALAEALVMAEEREIYTEGTRHGVINVDTLSAAFLPGEEVDINRLKKKKLIASDVGYLKVLARGSIDKPLTVYADAFSLGAIKMIALTGGRTFHVRTRQKP